MTNRLHFDLAAALGMADHAASSSHFAGPLNLGRMSTGPVRDWPAEPYHLRPAVLLIADYDVYLMSNGMPSQEVPGQRSVTYALPFDGPVTAEQVCRAAGLAPGMWLNYPLYARGGWVDSARRALDDGHQHLVVDLTDFSIGSARHSGETPA
jgi:hypothetical protein